MRVVTECQERVLRVPRSVTCAGMDRLRRGDGGGGGEEEGKQKGRVEREGGEEGGEEEVEGGGGESLGDLTSVVCRSTT